MADSKITGLTELSAAPSAGDMLLVVDVSDTTMAATGTNKKLNTNRVVFQDSGSVSITTLSTGQVKPTTGSGSITLSNPSSTTPLVRITSNTAFALQMLMSDVLTDAATKTARMACEHYLNAEEDFLILTAQSSSTDNNMFWGGNTSSFNAATQHSFYAAANTTTVTGTEILRLNSGTVLVTVPIYGSTSSAGSLTLSSTSHATKGKIYLGATSAFDEVNTRLGIGKVSPVYNLDVSGSIQADILGGTWSALTYESGWQDYSVAYAGAGYKVVGDFVFLRGLMVRVSGSSANIGTLPVGYRPLKTEIIPIVSNNAFAVITINTSGVITLDVGSPTVWVSLSGVCFSNI